MNKRSTQDYWYNCPSFESKGEMDISKVYVQAASEQNTTTDTAYVWKRQREKRERFTHIL